MFNLTIFIVIEITRERVTEKHKEKCVYYEHFFKLMITNKCTVKCFSNEALNRIPALAVSAIGMALLKGGDSSLVEDRILHDTATIM